MADAAGDHSDDAGSADPQDGDLQSMMADEGDVDELLDTSYSPPERQPYVNFDHENLDERLSEELPEVWDRPDDDDGLGDCAQDGELRDHEVGVRRSGRLVAPDEGAHSDTDSELFASDVGIDGGAASAEEAAIHIVDDEEEDDGEDY